MQKTPLHAAHQMANAKFVEFAGYEMPIQYQDGILKEHLWVRDNVGIFDVSHMGQVLLEGDNITDFIEHITPSSFANLEDGKAKYTVLTNENGGIIDDLIITRINEKEFFVVINAGCKAKDIEWLKKHLPSSIKFTELANRALIAVQGSKAEEILDAVLPDAKLADQPYMALQKAQYHGEEVFISRTGYTGEDGFEISISENLAEDFWNELLANENVKPIGLGARDTLRLEMGYPLYGHDLNEEISPIEAALSWVVGKEKDKFIGSDRILKEKSDGAEKKRVGLSLVDKGIAREGSVIVNKDGKKIGEVTSGGFGPTVNKAIAQGYVDKEHSTIGNEVYLELRGRKIKAEICSFTFLKAKTKK